MLARLIKKIAATLLLLLDALFMLSFILVFLRVVVEAFSARTPARMLASLVLAAVYLFLIVAAVIVGDRLWKKIEE